VEIDFGQQARRKPHLYKPMSEFFREHRFVRLAVTATVKTTYPDHLHLMQPVILVLKNYMAEIAALSSCCFGIGGVREFQPRGRGLDQHFGTLIVERNGSNIAVEHCVVLIEKKCKVSALEVADFVANSAGRLLAGDWKGSKGFRETSPRLPVGPRPLRTRHGYQLCFWRRTERINAGPGIEVMRVPDIGGGPRVINCIIT
jgi:hypothetical protein